MSDPPVRPRPDLFALPSGTTVRFGLLLLTIGAAAVIWGPFWGGLLIGHGLDTFGTIQDACTAAIRRDVWPFPWMRLEDQLLVVRACSNATSGPAGVPALAYLLGPLPVLVATLLACSLAPAWRIRRRGLVPFPDDRLPDVAAELDLLAARAGVRVRFLLDLLDPRAGGMAFGRPGLRYVLVQRGLLMRRRTDPEAFRAVVLHELAHVRNRDLDVTQLTVVLWWAFLVLTVPMIVWAQVRDVVNPATEQAYQFTWLAAFVLLLRNAVLRSRELHADAREATWSGDRAALDRLLAGSGRSDRWWPLRRHPPAAVRLAVVRGVRSLLVDGFWVGCALGLVLSFSIVDSALNQVALISVPDPYVGVLLHFGPVVLLVAAGLVLAAWRAVADSLVRGGRPPVGRLGLGVAAGLVGGTFSGPHVLYPRVFPNAMEVVTMLTWAGMVAIAAAALVSWLAAGARAWLAVSPNRGSAILPLAVQGALASLALLVLLQALQTGPNGSSLILPSLLLPWAPLPLLTVVAVALGSAVVLPLPITAGLLVLLPAYPLLASARAAAAGRRPASWLWDGPAPEAWRPPDPLRARPWLRLTAGLGTAGVLVAVLAIADVVRPAPGTVITVETALIAAVAAAIAAVRPGELRVVTAVLVGTIAGMISAPVLDVVTRGDHSLDLAALSTVALGLAGVPFGIVCAQAAAWVGDLYRRCPFGKPPLPAVPLPRRSP